MPSTKDINLQADPHKILLVGENGSGKSLAAASFYLAGPTRVWDFDGRLKPVKSFYPEADISYDTYGLDNFNQFMDELNNIINSCPYKTLILDSVTTASATCVAYQLQVTGNLKAGKGGIPATSWSEINGETVLFTRMLELLKVLHKKYKTNIIWTAHPIPKLEIGETETKRTTSIAAYGNKIPALIPGYFDEIYNFQKSKVGMTNFKYEVNTIPRNQLPGKTAFPGVIPDTMDITNKKFYEVLMSHLNQKKT